MTRHHLPPNHALAVLAADHDAVQQLLTEFDELAREGASAGPRGALARRICAALTAHAMAEEEIFYPAAREALQDDELIDAALAEHDGVRALVEHIGTLDAGDEGFDAMLMLLARAVAAHVRQEEGELFPRLQAAGLDMESLGVQIIRWRDETLSLLLAEASG